MPKFKKKPIVIEAFQLTMETRWDNKDWPAWLNYAWNKDTTTIGSLHCRYIGMDKTSNELYINTLEGVHRVNIGDWIIQGIQGELYPCKDSVFKLTYEFVS